VEAGQSPEDSFVWHSPNLNSYKRHNIEESLEGSGLEQRVPQPPAICFVDLTGYAPPNRGARRRGRRSGRGAAGRSGERHFTAIASLEKVNSTAPSSGSRSVAGTPAIRCCSTWAWVVPGAGGFATRSQFEPLEQHFTVVSWDEPGTGKSIGAVPLDQLTKERFVQDGRALTELLRQRFGQQRIICTECPGPAFSASG